jgi:hypothetical protein
MRKKFEDTKGVTRSRKSNGPNILDAGTIFSEIHFKVRAQLCKLQKGCTRLAAASDKVYQLLAHGRWFSLGNPASSTTKTGRH